MKRHMKRITAPSSWMIERKVQKFIARPKGSFSMRLGMPLIAILKDVLKLVETSKEGKRVLNSKEILVNGIRRKDEKYMIGLMDILQIKDIGKSFRVVLDNLGILRLHPVAGTEATFRLCKVIGKRTMRKGIIQIAFHDGRSQIGNAKHMIGDTVVVSIPDGKEKQHLKLENGCSIYLIGGSNVGRNGTIENISGDKVTVKIGDEVIEAARKSVFVTGKDKPVIKLD
jgi:small subunit ribosomal protein S4e